MHIIFATNELATLDNPSGGLATFTANIARLFKKHGNTVGIILVSTKESDISFDSDISLYNVFVPKDVWKIYDQIVERSNDSAEEKKQRRMGLVNIYKAHKVKELIDKIDQCNPIDVIHLCNHGSYSLFFDKSIPYVIRISGFYNIWFNGGDKVGGSLEYLDNPETDKLKLEVVAMKNASRVLAPSHLIASIASKELDIRTDVLESPFMLDKKNWNETESDILLKDGTKFVLFYGTLRILKGIHIIAQIARPLLENHPEIRLVLCGRDTALGFDEVIMASEYVKIMAGEFSDRVYYLGQLNRERLYPVIERAELVILPSRIENLSNACIESMAIGKIVIGTNGASFEQLIDDGVSGFLCERDNPESYLQAVEKALSLSLEEKEQMISAAKERIADLEPDKVYQNFLNYYNKVIEEWNA